LYDLVVGKFLSPDPNIADHRSLKVTTCMIMLGLLIFGVGVDFGFERPFDY
jgi:hypothetical protein